MGIARAHLQAFEAIMAIKGQTIIVHENFNTLEVTSHEVKGLKATAGKNSSQVIFQFPEALEIPVNAVLQVKGGRDYWRVTDTEDIVEEDVFIKFEARVEKINLAGQPTRPSARGATTYKTEINLSNSTIGILNTGEIEDVEAISVNVSSLAGSGHTDIAKAIKELTEAVATTQELAGDERTYLLENLEELSRQAALPPETRAKSGVIKSLISGIGSTLSAAGGMAEVWSTWEIPIRTFFGF